MYDNEKDESEQLANQVFRDAEMRCAAYALLSLIERSPPFYSGNLVLKETPQWVKFREAAEAMRDAHSTKVSRLSSRNTDIRRHFQRPSPLWPNP